MKLQNDAMLKLNSNMCRRRFNPNAVASSDGVHCRISHDRKAGTTGRTKKTAYARCGFGLSPVTEMQAAMLAKCQLVYRL